MKGSSGVRLSASLIVVLLAGAASAAAQQRIDPSDLGGTAVLTFADEFDSLSLWNGRSGTWQTTFPWSAGKNGATLAGNEEKQWYIDAAFGPTRSVRPWSVRDGKLTITAARAAPAIQPLIGGYRYVSGLLTTHESFRQTYGYFEMRAKLPTGQGLWPAFWLLPPDGKWPPEIDVVEMLGRDPRTIYASVHFEAEGRHRQEQKATAVPDTSADWHTYGVQWGPDEITWYFDRAVIFKTRTPPDLHGPMYMLVNLAVGGKWPGDPDASTRFPASMMVDYVRAYRPK